MNMTQAFRFAYYTGMGIRRAVWAADTYVTVRCPDYDPMLHSAHGVVRYIPKGYDFLLCDWRTYELKNAE